MRKGTIIITDFDDLLPRYAGTHIESIATGMLNIPMEALAKAILVIYKCPSGSKRVLKDKYHIFPEFQ